MSFINTSDQNGLRSLQIDHGTANTINDVFLTELRQHLRESLNDDAVLGLHITGKDHFFSAGLDIVELYDYPPEKFEQFWEISCTRSMK